MADALRIGGLWPTGRPSIVVSVSATDAIRRGDKSRAETLHLEREAYGYEIQAAVSELSQPFGEHAAWMVEEQMKWRGALARPGSDPAAVEAGLRTALEARGLKWSLRRFVDARAAWDAWTWDAAVDVRAAWDAWAWDAAWDASAAWDTAWDVKAALDAWPWATRDTRGRLDWDARAAWYTRAAPIAAWDTRAALIVNLAARRGWIRHPPDVLTRGLRDAYSAGLELAIPVGSDTLAWAMAPSDRA
jgi:hypothetical protein